MPSLSVQNTSSQNSDVGRTTFIWLVSWRRYKQLNSPSGESGQTGEWYWQAERPIYRWSWASRMTGKPWGDSSISRVWEPGCLKQILNYKSELENNLVENGRESRSLNQQQYEKRGKGATDEARRLSKEDLRTSSTCRWEKERWERKHRQCRLVERGRKGGRKRQSAQTMTCLLKTSRLLLPPCMQYS